MQVAVNAGQCEIIEVITATMNLWDDMLNVKRG